MTGRAAELLSSGPVPWLLTGKSAIQHILKSLRYDRDGRLSNLQTCRTRARNLLAATGYLGLPRRGGRWPARQLGEFLTRRA
jgi:hypothetical protein